MANDMSPTRLDRQFDLATFLEGHTRAWGIFEDRFGRLKRRFSVDMEGTWRDGHLELVENFSYDDGEIERRLWQIERGYGGSFTARSADCLGVARGRAGGDSATMSYGFKLKLKTRTVAVAFSDVFYRMDPAHMFNRAVVSKWGITLGVATIFFEKTSARPVSAV